MENTSNKIIKETDDVDNYWQIQAMLVMNNLNLSEKSKNTNKAPTNFELMEDISI